MNQIALFLYYTHSKISLIKMKIVKTEFFALFLLLIACNESAISQNGNPGLYESEPFTEYWYQGKAEVNSYNLDQPRYGETHPGKAMLIFVTESFSKKKQVKLDNPDNAGSDKVSVMKLNYTKNFVTGIYPYSMMLSTFTPISRNQYPNTVKVTMTSQEWCGHVFSQMNLNNNKYNVESYSYFESEGDAEFSTEVTLLEDELFNLIRVDPQNIPEGKIKILPGLFFTRLKHENLRPQDATLTKDDGALQVNYTLQYIDRTLTIHVQKEFPHKILGWEEEFTERGKTFKAVATLDKTLYTDYWRQNQKQYTPLRDSLGLSDSNY